MLQKVAVVGAGAAGLCAARHLLSRPGRFAPPVVFELSGHVGGTWCYEERAGPDERGQPQHSSMYRDLRTNLPKEVMKFPDFPFQEDLSSFLPHQEVLRYLQSYCERHQVHTHIRFKTVVEKVEPVVMTTDDGLEKTVWEVTSSDASGHRVAETFDSVFVCTGHYSDPHIPVIPGIEHFKGQVLHSHSYRFAEPFSGHSVVVLGARASGVDISMELAKAGAQVFLSHARPRLPFPLPPGVRECSAVEAVQEDGSVRFQDGEVGVADVLMFCTGYNFKFPFLDGGRLGLQVDDHVVAPLYRFLLPPAFPSLFFIGLCKIICPFPHFDCQVRFAVAVLDGSVALPSRAQMEDEVRRQQQEKADRGVERRHLLVLDQDQWEYCDSLARWAGFPPLDPVIRDLYEEVWRQRKVHPQNYRRINYRLASGTRWQLEDASPAASVQTP